MNEELKRQRDQIKVGDYVTILEWTQGRDNSWVGDALEVLHLEYPFIIVNVVKDEMAGNVKPITLDQRLVEFLHVSEDFVTLSVLLDILNEKED